MSEPIGIQVELTDIYENAIEKVISALKDEGFGVMTRIDVQATFKEKLDVDFRPYVILGACNPPLAYQALQSEPKVGLLLPCNVTVEEIPDGALVSIVNPEAMFGIYPFSENQKIKTVAAEARLRLERVVTALTN